MGSLGDVAASPDLIPLLVYLGGIGLGWMAGRASAVALRSMWVRDLPRGPVLVVGLISIVMFLVLAAGLAAGLAPEAWRPSMPRAFLVSLPVGLAVFSARMLGWGQGLVLLAILLAMAMAAQTG